MPHLLDISQEMRYFLRKMIDLAFKLVYNRIKILNLQKV